MKLTTTKIDVGELFCVILGREKFQAPRLKWRRNAFHEGAAMMPSAISAKNGLYDQTIFVAAERAAFVRFGVKLQGSAKELNGSRAILFGLTIGWIGTV